ncbi:unnamed protein product [Gulo gulo]|uniref:Uncharacterized protein n=1 Tax=Gulo gulo TaxID=48420 RepID=A0A9X9M703_GULGU|nr:unnamed protein product [Gulo gulo]
MLNKFSVIARNSEEVKPICYVILRAAEGVLMSSAGTTAELGMLHNSPSITFIG